MNYFSKSGYYALAISNLAPNAKFSVGDTYESIQWFSSDIELPPKTEIDAEFLRLEAEFNSNVYRKNREKEYPSIGDQLDALFKAGVFPEEMAAQIQAVKDKYPKSE